MSVLLVCAHPQEGDRVVAEHPETLVTGVGKVAAAIGVTKALSRSRALARLPEAVLLFGVCGAYPQRHRTGGVFLEVGDACVVGDDVLADEGVATPHGFEDLEKLGLGRVGPFTTDGEIVAKAAALLGNLPVVRGATVSTCSGSEAASAAIATRTGATVETMEGAAVAAVCRQFSVPLLQLRVVSNETGDRDTAKWALEEATAMVQDLTLKLMARRWLP